MQWGKQGRGGVRATEAMHGCKHVKKIKHSKNDTVELRAGDRGLEVRESTNPFHLSSIAVR